MKKSAVFYPLILALAVLAFLPQISYAYPDHHTRRDRQGYHHYRNPDLTLVSGMDNIDCHVLVAAGPDQ